MVVYVGRQGADPEGIEMDIQKMAGLLIKAENKFYVGDMSVEAFMITEKAIYETAAAGGYSARDMLEAKGDIK